MTQQEYEQKKRKCWEEFIDEAQSKVLSRYEIFSAAFDRAYALDKQEKDAEDIVITGWVARNRYNELYLYTEKPHRINCGIVFGEHTDAWSSGDLSFFPLDKELFPDLTWDDDPQEVELVIKKRT